MAGQQPSYLTRREIQLRYGVTPGVVRGWLQEPGFPAPVKRERDPGQVGGREQERYDEGALDTWVKDHHEKEWTFAHQGQDEAIRAIIRTLPEGDDWDLLNSREFGEIFGNHTRGKPLGASTMRSYLSRGQIPPPDATPDDEDEPQVYEPHWYRQTIYLFLANRPGRGGAGRTRTRQDGPAVDSKVIGTFPAGDPEDLLTLEEVGVLLGNYTRGAAYPRQTMVGYRNTGKIPTEDRSPEDGREPAVDEPKYYRRTIEDFARAKRTSSSRR